jgi:transcription antitermination factor NusA-like protein
LAKVLLVGKGALYESIVKSLKVKLLEERNIDFIEYDNSISKLIKESLETKVKLIVNEWGKCEIVYLFPESSSDGIILTSLFAE